MDILFFQILNRMSIALGDCNTLSWDVCGSCGPVACTIGALEARRDKGTRTLVRCDL